jgi:hypothetical protein
MASTVQLKRSALSGKVPDTGSLALGEVAINTYDGKIYFKKSGSVESIEGIVTTNSVTTGSITLLGTGSFGVVKGSIEATNGIVSGSSQITISDTTGFTTFSSSLDARLIAATNEPIFATTGSNQFTGSQNITGSIRATETGSFGSLNVNDTLTVNHGISIISGSLGVTSDLTVLGQINARQFNISVISSSILFESGSSKFGNTSDDIHSFTGSVEVTGSVTATLFVGDGSSLTNLNVDISSAQLNEVDGNNIPARSFAELFVACAIAEIVDLDFGI